MRVLQKPADSKIHTLFSTTVAIRNRFTPMSYIKYLARDFERSLGNMEIEKEDKVTTDVILDDTAVQLLPLAEDLGNRNNRTQEQKAEGKVRVDSFVEQNRGSSVMVFSDGSVNEEYSGVGGCAAVLLPIESWETEMQQTEVFSVLSNSTEAEVCGIALALDMAIQYFSTHQERSYRESLFVLSDCKAAMDIVINGYSTSGHVHVLSRIRSHLRSLHSMMVDVVLVWIPGHCDIHYHDVADHSARSVTLNDDNIPSTLVTSDTCKKLIAKQVKGLWQTRWQRVNSATFDIMPTVGCKLSFPREWCCAISYVRLLLDDSLLKAHQHRIGVEVSKCCNCGLGVDDVEHFLLQCTLLKDQRQVLKQDMIQTVLEECDSNGNMDLSVQLLLFPFANGHFTDRECREILSATFRFIRNSQRQL